ncbi:MAG: DUF4118 domain-containing protein [Methylococcaceae bacterium]
MKSQLLNTNLINHLIHCLLGIFIILALTLISWLFRGDLIPSNILLIYLLGVFFAAIQLGLLASIIAALSSAIAFAFFFAPPIFSLKIAEFDNLLGLMIMLVVAVMTSNLTENLRLKSSLIADKEQKTAALYALNQELSLANSEKELIIVAVKHFYQQFKKLNTILLANTNESLTYPKDTAFNISLTGFDINVANWVFKQAQSSDYHNNHLSNESFSYLPLNCAMGTLGVLIIETIELNTKQQEFFNAFMQQIIHSIERLKLANQAKEATLKMQTEALRNSLLSSISHDLRTPLAIIISAANNLETQNPKLSLQNTQKLARTIHEQAQRMTDLSTKILEMAKLETGEVVLHKQWYTPEELIGSALQCLHKQLIDRQINISCADNLSLIYVDAVLIQQVIINLLDNANKYSAIEKPIDIIVDSNHKELMISIADRGEGIAESFKEKIFEKFFQLHKETPQRGVGLGLSICKAIINAHGGEIHAINREGGGLMVIVNLPTLENPPTMDLEPYEN